MSRVARGPLLAIEMSQRGGSVAVGTRSDALACVRFDSGGAKENDPLLPAIDRAVGEADLRPTDLAAVAVSVGPGGFTGLRISVTAAKCMSEALGVPAIAVPSALVAVGSAQGSGPWLVALASKRDTCWLCAVSGERDDPRFSAKPGLGGAADIERAAGTVRTLLADEFAPPALVAVAQRAGIALECPRFEATACWQVAAALWGRGSITTPLELAPIYPREPEAVTLWRARHGD